MLAERIDTRPINKTPLYVEGVRPNILQVEENKMAEKALSQEVRDILATASPGALELTFSDFLSLAVKIYPGINSVLETEKASKDVLSSLEDDPLWTRWGVVKSIVWETVGPTKFGNHFGIGGNTLQAQVKHLSAVDVAEMRTVVDQIVTQEEKAS